MMEALIDREFINSLMTGVALIDREFIYGGMQL